MPPPFQNSPFLLPHLPGICLPRPPYRNLNATLMLPLYMTMIEVPVPPHQVLLRDLALPPCNKMLSIRCSIHDFLGSTTKSCHWWFLSHRGKDSSIFDASTTRGSSLFLQNQCLRSALVQRTTMDCWLSLRANTAANMFAGFTMHTKMEMRLFFWLL